jgi:hypothetical protein
LVEYNINTAVNVYETITYRNIQCYDQQQIVGLVVTYGILTSQNTVRYDQVYDLLLVSTLYVTTILVYDLLLVRTLYVMTKFMICYVLRKTGCRNLMGQKTLPTIWGTYMKLVTKYQISAINSC